MIAMLTKDEMNIAYVVQGCTDQQFRSAKREVELERHVVRTHLMSCPRNFSTPPVVPSDVSIIASGALWNTVFHP